MATKTMSSTQTTLWWSRQHQSHSLSSCSSKEMLLSSQVMISIGPNGRNKTDQATMLRLQTILSSTRQKKGTIWLTTWPCKTTWAWQTSMITTIRLVKMTKRSNSQETSPPRSLKYCRCRLTKWSKKSRINSAKLRQRCSLLYSRVSAISCLRWISQSLKMRMTPMLMRIHLVMMKRWKMMASGDRFQG